MAPQPWADPLHSILWGESYLGFCKILSHYPPIQTENKSCYSRSAKHQNSHHQYNDWCRGFDVMIFKQKKSLSYSFFYDVSFWRDFQLDLISVLAQYVKCTTENLINYGRVHICSFSAGTEQVLWLSSASWKPEGLHHQLWVIRLGLVVLFLKANNLFHKDLTKTDKVKPCA